MENKPKLILLYGFAGCGKTTIANKYINEHPLILKIEHDEIISMLGQWKDNAEQALRCKQNLIKSMIATHVRSGHDVILPLLPQNTEEVEIYDLVARENDVQLIEVLLEVEKEEAIDRLFTRGTWGEEGLPPLTESDRPKVEQKFDAMMEVVGKRENVMRISSVKGEIEQAYQQLVDRIG